MLRIAVAVALGLALACGKSDDQQVFDERAELCRRFFEQHEQVDSAVAALGGTVPTDLKCEAGMPRLTQDECGGGGSGSHATALCRRTWTWVALDETLCNPALGYDLKCTYQCVVYSPPSDPQQLVDTSVICASSFRSPRGAP